LGRERENISRINVSIALKRLHRHILNAMKTIVLKSLRRVEFYVNKSLIKLIILNMAKGIV
jgi:hypothetical protein